MASVLPLTPAPAPVSTLQIESELLGPLTATPEDLISFPEGILGFPEGRTWVLVPAAKDGWYWLQSTDFRALTFLLVDPFGVFPGYAIDVPMADQARLGTGAAGDVHVLSIVTLPDGPGKPFTANLQGPLLFNRERRVAIQAVLADSGYGTREPLPDAV